jgi:outer membrane protein assembly factor BamB
VIAALLALAFVWLTGDASGQQRTTATGAVLILAGVLLTLWLAFLSRLPWRVRVAGLAGVALAGSVFAALFRVRGVTGNLVPVFESRWSPRSESLPPLPPAREATAAAAGVAPATVPDTAADASPQPASPDPGTSASGATKDTPVPSDSSAAAAGGSSPARSSLPAYPQYGGPERDATLAGPQLSRDWRARPPLRKWQQAVGEGWSGFALADGIAVTQEQRGPDERVVAYDAASGRPLWSHADPLRYATTIAGVGPRATPTIANGRVFTMGATGLVNALDLATGRSLWRHDVLAETGATSPEWGKSASPLVVDDRVIVSAGGPDGRSLVAYDAGSGRLAWSAGSDRSSYSSPFVTTLAGRRQVVILNGGTLAGHDPATGAALWEHPFPGGQPNVTAPLPLGGDRLLVSVGYGIGAKSYRVAANGSALSATLEWESPRLKSKFGNLVRHDGSVYGLDDGVLTCLDPANGERRWKDGRYGHGQLLLVGGLLLVQTEEGELVLIQPATDGLRELARFQALEGKTWNPPALAGRLLLVRNDREAAAYELPVD